MLLECEPGGNLSERSCPNCRCKGNYRRHGSYARMLVTPDGEERIVVERVRCMSCGTTHALIPPDVVPHGAYSRSFADAVLAAWAAGMSNAEVRRRYGVPETSRRRLLAHARRRACSLLACNPTRAAVASAVGVRPGSCPADVRLTNSHGRARGVEWHFT